MHWQLEHSSVPELSHIGLFVTCVPERDISEGTYTPASTHTPSHTHIHTGNKATSYIHVHSHVHSHTIPTCTHTTPTCTHAHFHTIPTCTHTTPTCTHENTPHPDAHMHTLTRHPHAHMHTLTETLTGASQSQSHKAVIVNCTSPNPMNCTLTLAGS